MSDIQPNTFPKPTSSSLPAHLKDPANYKKICKAILEVGATKHSHGELFDWYKCVHCQSANKKVQQFKLGLGFKNGAEYMAWKKVHEKITDLQKVKLRKYNE